MQQNCKWKHRYSGHADAEATSVIDQFGTNNVQSHIDKVQRIHSRRQYLTGS